MRALADYRYAALDLETTGLSPRYHHRVVEVGIVLFTLDGHVESEYETLVNPRRDLGETSDIHGLTMADLSHAPVFDQVAADVSTLLKDRVIVAHNARFDLAFLASELGRAGLPAPELPHLCTMELAGASGLSRRLRDVCTQLAVLHTDAHTAIGDARAVASVLSRWYNQHPKRASLRLIECGSPCEPGSISWPEMTPSGLAVPRSEATKRAASERSYLARLLDRLPPASADSSDEAAYLDVLERALEDRHLSQEEALELAWVAGAEGLSALDLRRLHEEFFDALTATAWQDGIVTDLEAADLRLVGEFLALPPTRIEEAIATERRLERLTGTSTSHLAPGTSVCFTGALRATVEGAPLTREEAQCLAEDRGLVVRDSVTKKLDILVVADPLSQSGKAKKARSLGTRILAEAAFWQLLGVRTD